MCRLGILVTLNPLRRVHVPPRLGSPWNQFWLRSLCLSCELPSRFLLRAGGIALAGGLRSARTMLVNSSSQTVGRHRWRAAGPAPEPHQQTAAAAGASSPRRLPAPEFHVEQARPVLPTKCARALDHSQSSARSTRPARTGFSSTYRSAATGAPDQRAGTETVLPKMSAPRQTAVPVLRITAMHALQHGRQLGSVLGTGPGGCGCSSSSKRGSATPSDGLLAQQTKVHATVHARAEDRLTRAPALRNMVRHTGTTNRANRGISANQYPNATQISDKTHGDTSGRPFPV